MSFIAGHLVRSAHASCISVSGDCLYITDVYQEESSPQCRTAMSVTLTRCRHGKIDDGLPQEVPNGSTRSDFRRTRGGRNRAPGVLRS